jgi:hypothetical protein
MDGAPTGAPPTWQPIEAPWIAPSRGPRTARSTFEISDDLELSDDQDLITQPPSRASQSNHQVLNLLPLAVWSFEQHSTLTETLTRDSDRPSNHSSSTALHPTVITTGPALLLEGNRTCTSQLRPAGSRQPSPTAGRSSEHSPHSTRATVQTRYCPPPTWPPILGFAPRADLNFRVGGWGRTDVRHIVRRELDPGSHRPGGWFSPTAFLGW